MKVKHLLLSVAFALGLGATASRAGMTIYNPPGNQTGGNFTIYYGLGSPAPGKVAYVYVLDPTGRYYQVASAENVSDMSQVAYLYASYAGTYRFFYEYSYYSQGIGLTQVYNEDHSISPGPQPTVSSANKAMVTGYSFTPQYYGGSGSGNWQFVIANYTNWSPSTYGQAGTNIPGVGWSTSWTPPGPGSYTFYVAKCGDSNWQTSNFAGPYTLTVNAVSFNWGNTPSQVMGGTQYNVNVGVSTGGMPYVTLYKNGAYFAAGWYGTQGNTVDTPTQTVTYQAVFSDSVTNSSGSNSRGVYVYQGYTLSTAANPSNGGSVSGAGTYSPGTQVSVTATPATNYVFTGWSGGASGLSNPVTVTMNGNVSVTANFALATYTVSASASPSYAGTVSGAGTYSAGSSATLTASAQSGYVFSNWSGAISSTANPVSFAVNGNMSVVANFAVPASAPSFTVQPQNQSVISGASVSFSIAASGSPAPTFQWQRLPSGSSTWSNVSDGGSYSGSSGMTLTVSGVTTAMSGDQFRCIATNSVGSVPSSAATLTVGSADSSNQNQLNTHIPTN